MNTAQQLSKEVQSELRDDTIKLARLGVNRVSSRFKVFKTQTITVSKEVYEEAKEDHSTRVTLLNFINCLENMLKENGFLVERTNYITLTVSLPNFEEVIKW